MVYDNEPETISKYGGTRDVRQVGTVYAVGPGGRMICRHDLYLVRNRETSSTCSFMAGSPFIQETAIVPDRILPHHLAHGDPLAIARQSTRNKRHVYDQHNLA